jgi:Na+/melibiose symporter-like transporter
MSSFHASFSIGGLTGALIGAGLASLATVTPLLHFTLAAVLFGSIMVFSYPHLLPAEGQPQEKTGVFRLPERALWLLGSVAFCSALAEGAMADWSALYLNQVFETTAGFAALGFAAFSLTMTVGRLLGDSLTRAWRPTIIVRAGGFVATLGFLALVLTTEPSIALIGFAAIGLGLANIIPLSFSAAGNYPGITTGIGIAGVATIGYAGFLAGPPIIGFVAEITTLRVSLLFVTLLVGTLIFTAKALAPTK